MVGGVLLSPLLHVGLLFVSLAILAGMEASENGMNMNESNRIGMVGGKAIGGKSSPPHDDATHDAHTKAKNFWEEATSTIEIERRTSLVGVTSTSLVRLLRRFIIEHKPRCVQEQKQVQQQRLQPTRSMPALRCLPVADFHVDARPLRSFFCFKRSSLRQCTTHRRLVL